MASLWRIPVVWSGLGGLPGVSVFYGAPAGSLVSDLKTYFTGLVTSCPSGLSWQIPTSGDVIDDATGTLTGGWTDSGGGVVSATGTGAYAAGTGFFTRWQSNIIVNGRRLRGRTFIAPITAANFQSDGTILNSSVVTYQTLADALITGADLMIWHRPTNPGGTDGESHNATSAQVVDRVTSLRSRRT